MPASVTELQRAGLLAELPGQALAQLADRMLRQEVAAGTAIVREDELDDRFYILLGGVAAVSQTELGPRRLLRPGDAFGEVAAAMGVERTATVTAITPCVVASCDQATFDEFVRPLYADSS